MVASISPRSSFRPSASQDSPSRPSEHGAQKCALSPAFQLGTLRNRKPVLCMVSSAYMTVYIYIKKNFYTHAQRSGRRNVVVIANVLVKAGVGALSSRFTSSPLCCFMLLIIVDLGLSTGLPGVP